MLARPPLPSLTSQVTIELMRCMEFSESSCPTAVGVNIPIELAEYCDVAGCN